MSFGTRAQYSVPSEEVYNGLQMCVQDQMQFVVGAGFPRPIAWIIDLGGENPPLQCWAHYFFECRKPIAAFKHR